MKGSAVDASAIVGQAEGPFAVSYTRRDLIIYALGIGAETRRFVDENDVAFGAFPTYPLVLPYKGTSSDIVPFPGQTLFLLPQALRGVVNTGAILHYDQSIDVLEPLEPRGAELESCSVVLGVYRRRGGVLLRTKTTLKDRSGRTLTETTQGTFMRGLEITGDVGPSPPPRANPPTAPPDVVAAVTVSPQQALWYRLSGDYNAIHVDPEAATAAGLERPILHGLCSLGIATREILQHFCPEDLSSGLVSLYCRFSKAVFPGDVLHVKMWGRAASHVWSSGGDGNDTGNDRMGSAAVTGAEGAPPAAGVNGGAAIGIAEDGRSSSSSATTCARRGHRGLVPHRGRVWGSSTPTKAARETEERSQQQGVEEVRFEVCSPRLGGAVVVADGRAVVRRGKRFGEGVLKGGVRAPRNRSRL
ncbi:unnamed protein product [Ectocarpus sp. CCAP 1310/34]|nr:unnamed protein product [Ectocarpus sp. CCAP 1310/34]